ncbi:ABC transporter permease [Arthrobacter sp. Hiyo1]|uniref:ABC transporter permease n=1 Tax=Arthrobacter sp. Hiyo1 TaxID=1588020 RepID=UPI0030F46A10
MTTMLVAAVVLALSFAFGVLRPAGWYWLPALAAIGLIALAAAGLGTALGGALRRFSAVAGAGINLSIYLFFLSGGISVAAFLPDWIQAIAHFTPTFYGVDALEAAIFYQSTDNLGRDLAVLLATAAVGLVLGTVSLRRRLVDY